jgi:hypothetical protein
MRAPPSSSSHQTRSSTHITAFSHPRITVPSHGTLREWRDSIAYHAFADIQAITVAAPDVNLAADALIAQLVSHHSGEPMSELPTGVLVADFSFDHLVSGERGWAV